MHLQPEDNLLFPRLSITAAGNTNQIWITAPFWILLTLHTYATHQVWLSVCPQEPHLRDGEEIFELEWRKSLEIINLSFILPEIYITLHGESGELCNGLGGINFLSSTICAHGHISYEPMGHS